MNFTLALAIKEDTMRSLWNVVSIEVIKRHELYSLLQNYLYNIKHGNKTQHENKCSLENCGCIYIKNVRVTTKGHDF